MVELQEEHISILDPIDEFYSKPLYFSYSSLKKLIWAPQSFYSHYILNEREERLEKHLLTGKVIHCLLLNPEQFNQLFVVSPVSFPSGNTKSVIDRLFRKLASDLKDGSIREIGPLSSYGDTILQILVEIDLHQSLKTDPQRLDKIITDETNNYFQYLKEKGAKDVIDAETFTDCQSIADRLSTIDYIRELMGMDPHPEIQVINEEEMRVKAHVYQFGLKGVIDNLVIDHKKKEIRLNDLKNTSKGIADFTETVEFYQYWLQGAIYATLVHKAYGHLIENGYVFLLRFIVIDSMQQVYPFLVTDTTLQSWFTRLTDTLYKANYHYTERKYELPYEYSKGLVTL